MGLKSFISDLYSVKSAALSIDDVYSRFGGFGIKTAGVTVNQLSAIQHATVYACVRDKSESIGQLPIRLYRTSADGTKQEVKKGREHRIFTKKPNDFMTAQDLLMMYVTCMELYGNFYAYIVRNDRGSIAEIIPFRHQSNVNVQMDINGNVYYSYVTNDGKSKLGFFGEEIMHIRLNSMNGLTGLSPISCNAGAIGLGMAQEKHLSGLMANGAMPKGLLETDLIFKDVNKAVSLREEFDERYAGVENSGKSVLLENGLKFKPLTISPADSELLLSRQYSQQQICGIHRVPPRRIGASTVAKQADIEQENKDYYVNSLMPMVTMYENIVNLKTPDNLEVKVDERGFVRGDLASQVESGHNLMKSGLGSMNEGRDMIGLPPIEGGEVHAIDTNNLTFGLVTDIPKLQEEQRALALASTQQTEAAPAEENSDA